MKDLSIITKIKNKIDEMFKYENTDHDISHLERVYQNALKIQEV